MRCLFPPALGDDQLLAYLTGNAPAEVHHHLAHCADCRMRLGELQAWQSWLTKNLYRTPCPSTLALGEYQLGLLPKDQMAVIAQHLAFCAECRREVQAFHTHDQPVLPERPLNLLQHMVDQVHIIVARLIEAPGATPTLAMSGIRGQESTKSFTYAANELEIALLIQPDSAQPAQRMLLGWVSGYEGEQTLVEVHLWQGLQPIATTTLDSLGNFVFSSLPPGQYGLILQRDRQEIYLNDIAL